MRHVFVETNWVVAYAAPAHHKVQVPAAFELLGRAAAGELIIYLPSICISEARRPLHERFQVRRYADQVRQFTSWARNRDHITSEEDETTRRVLDRMENRVRDDLNRLDATLAELRQKPGLEIFDITQSISVRCTELSFLKLDLEPFDQMILAAVLIRAKELVQLGETEVDFCEIDTHLQPWDKNNNLKQPLASLYDGCSRMGLWRFLLEIPCET